MNIFVDIFMFNRIFNEIIELHKFNDVSYANVLKYLKNFLHHFFDFF